jgi:hypothetical protein
MHDDDKDDDGIKLELEARMHEVDLSVFRFPAQGRPKRPSPSEESSDGAPPPADDDRSED